MSEPKVYPAPRGDIPQPRRSSANEISKYYQMKQKSTVQITYDHSKEGHTWHLHEELLVLFLIDVFHPNYLKKAISHL
jgi:hypothetical protein